MLCNDYIMTAAVYVFDWNFTSNVNANLDVLFWLQGLVI